MSPKVRFGALVLVWATVLFVAWPLVSDAYSALSSAIGSALRQMAGAEPIRLTGERDSWKLIPVFAVVAASLGHTVRQKAAAVGLTFAGFTLLGGVSVALRLIDVIAQGSFPAWLFFMFMTVVYPAGVLVAFVRGRPDALWTRSASRITSAVRCPVCNTRAFDLREHVIEHHGRDALRLPSVRRALNLTGR